MAGDKRFYVKVNALKEGANPGDIAEFLSTVFKTKTPEDVAVALNDLPLTVVSDIDEKSATLLSGYLEDLKVEAAVEEITSKGSEAGEGSPALQPSEGVIEEKKEPLKEPPPLSSEPSSPPPGEIGEEPVKKKKKKRDSTCYIRLKTGREEIFSTPSSGKVMRANDPGRVNGPWGREGPEAEDDLRQLERDRASRELDFTVKGEEKGEEPSLHRPPGDTPVRNRVESAEMERKRGFLSRIRGGNKEKKKEKSK